MSNFILATRQTQLDGERLALRTAIQDAGHTCTVVNPNHCVYEFKRGEPLRILMWLPYNQRSQDIATADYLIARSTSGCRPAAYLMAQSLHDLMHCKIVDPVIRYQCDIEKMRTTILLFDGNRGIDTWCVFSDVGLDQIINDLPYPVVVKPHNGSHGKGVVVINNPALLRHHAMSLLSSLANYPVYIQRYMRFDAEYRVLCCNGEVIGTVQRERSSGDFMRSSKKMVDDCPMPTDWIPQGIVGVDVGVIGDNVYIIEQNYAPEWNHFENVTRINVSKKIIETLTRRESHV